jgi:cytochrome c oxidase subunit 2
MKPLIRLLVLSAPMTVPPCAQAAPLNYFLHAHGPAARPVMVLGWVFTAIVFMVCITIAALLLAAILRRRPPGNGRVIRGEGEGLRFIAAGTGLTVIVLLGMTVYMLVTLARVSIPDTPALKVKVTGYDWWWKVEYEGNPRFPAFTTANEMHIPTGAPVLVTLESADVIHAFWVPELAGKTQMIPGLTNRQWLQADEPGIYRGKCTQFCGVQHAHMEFEVVAEPAAAFEAWAKAQGGPVPAPSGQAAAGERIFMRRCASCHTVRGSGAAGTHGPDLTHLDSRRLIAAGMFENTTERRMDWVRHAQTLKPGCRMPDFPLSPQDAAALSAYLSTLK